MKIDAFSRGEAVNVQNFIYFAVNIHFKMWKYMIF